MTLLAEQASPGMVIAEIHVPADWMSAPASSPAPIALAKRAPNTGHFDRVGVSVYCELCEQRKIPCGRSAPMSMHGCSYECPGYRQAPHVGSLWPGERAHDFGFPVGSAGTRVEWIAYPTDDDD